jgi:hypothetical protein
MKSVAFNLANLKPNLEWASLPLFDRTRWTRVRFRDVVEQIKSKRAQRRVGGTRGTLDEHCS